MIDTWISDKIMVRLTVAVGGADLSVKVLR